MERCIQNLRDSVHKLIPYDTVGITLLHSFNMQHQRIDSSKFTSTKIASNDSALIRCQ